MFESVHTEEARKIGDPPRQPIGELIAEAPPCSKCKRRQAVEHVNGRDLCEECKDDSNKTRSKAVTDKRNTVFKQ